jgi:PAS domain S-box-containing protein
MKQIDASGAEGSGSARQVVPGDALEGLYRQIVERSQDAIIATDREGVIRLWNGGAENMFGYRAEEAVGSTLDLIIPEWLRQRHWDGYRMVMATGTTQYALELLTVPAVRKDGSRIPLEFRITLLRDTAGIVTGAAAMIREITEHWETIAHELRTPLTAVRSCIGLLRDPTVQPNPEAHAQLLKTIEDSAERMQGLVTDVLDLTRLRSGAIQLQSRRFDARVLARNAAAAVSPLLQARGQTISLMLASSPTWVFGDRRQLERALLNLVSNAQKFSPDGAAVRLTLSKKGDDVAWAVSDQGPGIAAADVAHLFERFFTMPPDVASGESGTGLGLPIARAIALAHGGAIDVESKLGQGSTFTLRVPAAGPPHGEEP